MQSGVLTGPPNLQIKEKGWKGIVVRYEQEAIEAEQAPRESALQ